MEIQGVDTIGGGIDSQESIEPGRLAYTWPAGKTPRELHANATVTNIRERSGPSRRKEVTCGNNTKPVGLGEAARKRCGDDLFSRADSAAVVIACSTREGVHAARAKEPR